ncbi:MAG TPA: DUF1697 domain-containing protein, partial [Bacteroidales bacterium]|nr:DUF1697 domain-containing protein [Bacteroidales bacterium]
MRYGDNGSLFIKNDGTGTGCTLVQSKDILIHFVILSAFEITKINLSAELVIMGNTYIGLLRGINVSGQKKIKMAELRDVLEEIGLKNVKTYIQSG